MRFTWSRRAKQTTRMRHGYRAERFVARRMKLRGFKILVRNFVWRGGEIDLIARRGDLLVVMEVRFRSNEDQISAKQTVDQKKQVRIMRGARAYIRRHPELSRCAVRFDVAGVTRKGLFLRCDWVENAFRASP